MNVRTSYRTCLPLLLLLLTSGGWASIGGGKRVPAVLQGKWRVVGMVVNGDTVSEDECRKGAFVFNGRSMTVSGFSGMKKFTYSLDSSGMPKAIDAHALNGKFKGKTAPGIYDLQGDTLRLCLPNDDSGSRPSDFGAGKGTGMALLTLTREG